MMKSRFAKCVLSLVLTLGMLLSLLPATALAVSVTTTPGGASLNVEYFDSTLYSWDEAAANAATAAVDDKANGVTTSDRPTIAAVQGGGYYLDEALSQEVSVGSETSSVESYTSISKTYSAICQT